MGCNRLGYRWSRRAALAR